VTGVVLDAAVVLKWFRTQGESHAAQASALRVSYQAGELLVLAPLLLRLEIVNVAGRRWRWDEPLLLNLAEALDDLGFDYRDPDLRNVSRWTARGLSAYDASYVALAEAESVPLITDDCLILDVAARVAVPLSGVGR
jgi:predicted nucleic acid-binding protein